MLLVKQQLLFIMLGNYSDRCLSTATGVCPQRQVFVHSDRCLSTVTGVWYADLQTGEGAMLSVRGNVHTVMRRLTTEIRSQKRVVRRYGNCANVYIHKSR